MAARISQEKEEKIIDLYNKKFFYKEIAVECDVVKTTVLNVLNRNKIIKRLPHQTHQKESDFNCNFFNLYNEENCYWAGFILTDGCIFEKHNSLIISLSKIDCKHLEKFIKIIDGKHKISANKTKATIEVCSKKMISDLRNNFDIVPRKTPIVKWNENIPKEFYKDFIRGLIDGDGSLSKSVKRNSFNIQFTCNNHIFTETVLQKIHESINGGILTKKNILPIIGKHGNSNTHWAISGTNAINVAHWLYDDSLENCRLDRKYKRYIELISLRDKGKNNGNSFK